MPLEQTSPGQREPLEDRQEQTTLYERYGPAIFGYMRLHTRVLEDAEDLLLEVFLSAAQHNNLITLLPEAQLAWQRRVAHNKLLNTYRQTSRSPQIALDTVVETLCEESGPEQFALHQEERGQMRAALRLLSPLQQQVLQLRYGDELRCVEIAVLLNKREDAVRKLLSRSILALRKAYQQAEEGEKNGRL
ncbi:MAG TPA: sigma-70 family RNA polymerase sigma factor [Ktedonobacteraceae bacterium]|nr:sigma-70 family RNA polymerase sigma factor [Ktedonobacteraceae bacterium]